MPGEAPAGDLGSRYFTLEHLRELLAENPPDNPAHDPETRYVPASPNVQAALAHAQRVAPVVRKAYPLVRREAAKRHALEQTARTPERALCPVVALAAPRERRNSRTASPSRAGPDGDSDPHEPRRETPAEIAARRLRELERFVEQNGLDYWYRPAARTGQLELGEAA